MRKNTADEMAQQAQSLQILIVEDDPVMQMGLVYTFTKYPQLQVIGHAEDGESAITSAIQLQPDLVRIFYQSMDLYEYRECHCCFSCRKSN